MPERRGEWQCGECSKLHQTEYAAMDCAEEDLRVEPEPPVHVRQLWYCVMCGKNYRVLHKAEACEKEHKTREDKHFLSWEVLENRRRLEVAACAEGQRKLISQTI